MKLYAIGIGILLGWAITTGAATTTTTDERVTKLEGQITALTDQVKSLEATIRAYHPWDQTRPPDDVAEIWVRVRRALKTCGCEFHDD